MDRVETPQRQRARITSRLRADVVKAYQAGATSRLVAEEFNIGKSTVLKILSQAGVDRRPQGIKY